MNLLGWLQVVSLYYPLSTTAPAILFMGAGIGFLWGINKISGGGLV